MAWRKVQYKDGKLRTVEDSGGGGGSSTFSGLNDVSFSNLQNGQVPKYNSTKQKWENADESGGGEYLPLIYFEEEREVGVYVDAKPVYQKTFVIPKSDMTGHDMTINHGISNLEKVIEIVSERL